MNRKPIRLSLYSLLIATVSITVFFSCQKELSNDQADLYERFFKLPVNASPSLIDMASSIRKLESQLNIAHNVASNNSLPVWRKSYLADIKDMANSSMSSSRGTIEASTGSFRTVITAVVDVSTNEITGFIKFMRANDTIRTRYVEKRVAIRNLEYAASKAEKERAIQDLFYIAYFEKTINNVEVLKLAEINITAVSVNTEVALMQACVSSFCHTETYCYDSPDPVTTGSLICGPYQVCYYSYHNCAGGPTGVNWQGCNNPPCTGGSGGNPNNGAGGSLTGGTGPNGSNYWGNPIFSVEGSGGGNGSGNNPRDSLIRDSTIKKRLHEDAVAMKDSAQKAWNQGFTQNVEYGFWGIDSTGVSKVGSIVHTSNKESEIKLERINPANQSVFVNSGKKIRYDYHIHQDQDVIIRTMHDPKDLTTLSTRLAENNVADFFTTYVDIGTKMYAVVIEDRAKAILFFNQHTRKLVDEHNTALGINLYAPTAVPMNNYMINDLIKNSSVSGIGVYVTNNIAKDNFIKLN
jgi:hypothetical protein